jgi:hypothetical protein
VQLFGDYLAEQNIADPRIAAMFAELLDEVTGSPDQTEVTGTGQIAGGGRAAAATGTA